MSSMISKIKGLVTRDVRRFKKDGYDLDLTYITDRLIVLGLTSSETALAPWKNNAYEVYEFLESHHPNHYKVFNLSTSTPDHALFIKSVWYGWPPGHTPTLETLFKIIYAMNDWFAQDPNNVAVIYSDGGKGRAGLVAASYLVYSGTIPNPTDALYYYASMRSPQHFGITIPSQRRYVGYVAKLRAAPFPPTRIRLTRLVLRPPPPSTGPITPHVKIFSPKVVPLQEIYRTPKEQRKTFSPSDREAIVDLNVEVEGDVIVKVYDKTSLLFVPTSILLGQFAFNTALIEGNTLNLSREEIDFLDAKRFPSSFQMILEVAPATTLQPQQQPFNPNAVHVEPVSQQRPQQLQPQQQYPQQQVPISTQQPIQQQRLYPERQVPISTQQPIQQRLYPERQVPISTQQPTQVPIYAQQNTQQQLYPHVTQPQVAQYTPHEPSVMPPPAYSQPSMISEVGKEQGALPPPPVDRSTKAVPALYLAGDKVTAATQRLVESSQNVPKIQAPPPPSGPTSTSM